MLRRFQLLVLLLLIGRTHSVYGQESVVFHKRATRAGDMANQSANCQLDLLSAIRQGDQVVQEQQQIVTREQSRRLSIRQVPPMGPWEADLHYDVSKITVQSGKGPSEAGRQGVEGKTYRITRQGDELHVTYVGGEIPPADEQLLVRENMAGFGRSNPIAEFFDGKSVRVGESLDLPKDLAYELVGFAQTPGAISTVRLKFLGIQHPDSTAPPVGRFALELVADDAQQGAVTMQLTGQLDIEIESCRTRAIRLQGPVSSEETHGPKEGQYQVRNAGQMSVDVQAHYSSFTPKRTAHRRSNRAIAN